MTAMAPAVPPALIRPASPLDPAPSFPASPLDPAPSFPASPPGPAPSIPSEPAGASPRLARRVRMSPGPGAAAAARAEVAAAIRAWEVAVDLDVAVLLTSELVTNAVTHGAASREEGHPGDNRGATVAQVVVAITADVAGLRVDVHDGSSDLPVLKVPVPEMPVLEMPVLQMPVLQMTEAEPESGRGLLLVTSLSDEWGCYRTPAGKAVYFTLNVQPGADVTVTDGWRM
jgi:hypothetical protein